MLNLLKEWNNTISSIEEQNLVKKTGKRIDLFAILFTTLVVALPYLIFFFNCYLIYSPNTIIFHIILWTLPFCGNLFFSLNYLFFYQILKIYLKDEFILNQTSGKRIFFGGLIYPFTFIAFTILCIALEFLI